MPDKRDLLVEDFLENTHTLFKTWKTQFFKLIGDSNISPAQASMLLALKNEQPINGRFLAQKMHISRSAVTQLTDNLDALGYIERNEDKLDRRIIYLSLSKKGESKLRDLKKKRRQMIAKVAESLSDQELEQVVKINSKIIKELEN